MINLTPAIMVARLANGYLVIPYKDGHFHGFALSTRAKALQFIDELLANLPLDSDENNPFAKQMKDMAKGLKVPEDWVRDALKEQLGISPFKQPEEEEGKD